MLHRGGANMTGMRRWGWDRPRPRWGADLSPEQRTFDEELALFERQARDEAGRGAGSIGDERTSGTSEGTAA